MFLTSDLGDNLLSNYMLKPSYIHRVHMLGPGLSNFQKIDNMTKVVKVNPNRDRNIFVPTVCALKRNISLSLLISFLVMYILTD